MAAPVKKACELFVARLPWTVAQREVREYFGQFGAVRKCLIPFDSEKGFHKGICWVTFSSEEGVTKALQKDTHLLEGAKLIVQQNFRKQTLQHRNHEDSDLD